jgi:flagellar hook-associated protein 2
MVTSVSGSTSTASTASTTSTSSSSSVASSIANTLGAGSGIDTATLVSQLVSASYDPKIATVKAKQDANTAQISGIGQASSAVSGFASALSSLISGGTLFTQPNSSDTSVLTATAKAGARIGSLSTQIEVRQLAQGQSLNSGYLANVGTAVGKGTLTITMGSQSFDVTITDSNNTLTGLARAINNANSGVTASTVEDATGARLVLKGGTGTIHAFSVAASADSDASLKQFAYDPAANPATTTQMTVAQAAQDAILKQDGVTVTRSTNSISDLVDGVTLNLNAAKVGSPVTLTATQPTDAIKQAVTDFVDTYNALKATIDALVAPATSTSAAGALRGDPGIRSLQSQLSHLTSAVLASGGSVSTLAEIGVSTQRDGTLTVDTARLNAVLTSDPQSVENLFNPGQTSDNPLVKITNAYGRVKPGTYTVTNLVPGDINTPAQGTINGIAAIGAADQLVASVTSSAAGLQIQPLGTVASATITIDLGLGGALQQISDVLSSSNGIFTNSTARLKTEATGLADDMTKLTDQEDQYRTRLSSQFSTMNTRMNALNATKSYLTQQIALWTKSNN